MFKLLCALLLTVSTFAGHSEPQPILLGYFDNWTPGYSVADIEKSGAATHLSHLAYAFANVHAGTCALSNPKADPVNFAALRELRRRHTGLKTLISVGGANAANNAAFSAAAKSKQDRAKLAASCVQLFMHGNFIFDGIDLDWEFPAASDKPNFTALIAEFRAQMNATGGHPLLTIAAPAGKQNYAQIELAKVAAQIDFLNLMTYDYTGAWSKQTGHAAALSSVAATVKDYRDAGVSPAKIVLGIPFFGSGWTGVPATHYGLFQPLSKPAPTLRGDVLGNFGHGSFRALSKLSGFGSFNDKENKAHWIYSARTGTFWSYDDQRMISEKVRYLKQQGLAGAMVWELKDDTWNASLIKAIASGLHPSR